MGFGALDKSGRFVWLSRVEPEYVGETILGTHPWDWVDPPDRAPTLRAFSEAMVTGQPHSVTQQDLHGQTFDTTFMPAEGAAVICAWKRRENAAHLSDREREVLLLICHDHKAAEIESLLGIAPSTFETYRLALRRKLDVNGTAGMVRWAIRHGLFEA